MKRSICSLVWVGLTVAFLLPLEGVPREIRVAVASNFSGVLRLITKQFEAETGHSVILVNGSSGKHFAQIRNGAPFDAFFSADVERPKRLEDEGVVMPGGRFTYALGRIVLWSPNESLVDSEGRVLAEGSFQYLAMANPKLAPYGRAAREVLEGIVTLKKPRFQIVQGENVAQAFQFVHSGNAELGFVAYSQIKRPGAPITGSYWLVPSQLYQPIEQQAVLLRKSSVAHAFLEFVKGEIGRAVIQEYGYIPPSVGSGDR